MDWKLLGIAAAVGATGCVDLGVLHQGVKGSGKASTEHRKISKFDAIDAKGAFDVDVRVGPATSVTITGDDNLLNLVETKVEGNTLTLNTARNVSPKLDLKVLITTPSLSSFDLHGAGDVRVSDVRQERFKMHLYGAGDISATGNVRELEASLYGAGDMDLFELKAENVVATIKGAGDMNVYASRRLDAKVLGAGDIIYRGRPKDVVRSTAGVGGISSAD